MAVTESLPGLVRDVPLAPLTTLGVGGLATHFFDAADEASAHRAIVWADAQNLPLFVLGGGSNVVISDRGWRGLVLRFCGTACSAVEGEDDTVLVGAGAGLDWDTFVHAMVVRGLVGLECLSGIPGFVGGAPIQNIGAYGQEVEQTIESVAFIDLDTLAQRSLSAEECGFSYRQSRFKADLAGRCLVTGVQFRLRRGDPAALRYPELQRRAAALGEGRPSLAGLRDLVLGLRRSKAMVIDPAEPDSRSVGSFFMNPMLAEEAVRQLEVALEHFGVDPALLPRYPSESGLIKVPAAWLIEQSGFKKGHAFGRAGISSKHSLALVNRGGAQATDILALAAAIRRGVRERFGIVLQPEPRFIGFERDVVSLLDGPQKD
jgi:UDP-N-acetylmuramate dehydrogenase